MSRLHLSRLSDHDAKDVDGVHEGDLMVRWSESSVQIHHRLPKANDVGMAWEAKGVVHLFESDESAMAFTKIIASWQNTMRPGSRLLLMFLFLASAGALCWFVYLQMRFMVPHLI
ncbi:hypothetical protein [Pseudomonas syringae]|uniref:hypothetical protein n=1 Tax=Pseudomonas syringae TaxID=317 RepID=UPI003F751844